MKRLISLLKVIVYGPKPVLPTLPTESRLICHNIWQATNKADGKCYEEEPY